VAKTLTGTILQWRTEQGRLPVSRAKFKHSNMNRTWQNKVENINYKRWHQLQTKKDLHTFSVAQGPKRENSGAAPTTCARARLQLLTPGETRIHLTVAVS
jgi:hypothetical protein